MVLPLNQKEKQTMIKRVTLLVGLVLTIGFVAWTLPAPKQTSSIRYRDVHTDKATQFASAPSTGRLQCVEMSPDYQIASAMRRYAVEMVLPSSKEDMAAALASADLPKPQAAPTHVDWAQPTDLDLHNSVVSKAIASLVE